MSSAAQFSTAPDLSSTNFSFRRSELFYNMLLSKIKQMNRLLLIQELSQQSAWEKVAKQFGLNPAIHLQEPSAYSLIKALENRDCTVENLEKCLRALNLRAALSIISKPEKLRLVKQPYCVETEDISREGDVLCVRAGGTLHLKIEAVGCPFLSYQWYRDNIPLSKAPELIISNFSDQMEGLYYCTIQQLQDFGLERRVISEDVTVTINIKVVYEAPRILSYFPTEKCMVECGQCLVARVEVLPDPTLTFSWRYNSRLLSHYTSNVLEIQNVKDENAGTYECLVSNEYGEVSRSFQFYIKKCPTAKRALIVTNSSYQNDKLRTPHNDAETLFKCLTKYDFICTLKRDLTAEDMKKEIKNFFQSVKEKGAFVLFYFGGHGCMVNNSLFMIGCDADLRDVKENQGVYTTILEDVDVCEPLLFISMLDMCQVSNNNLEGKQSNKKWNCNVIQCCATSQNREALEHVGSAKENSVYMKHFENIINTKENMPFLDMIRAVNAGVDEETKGRQRPSVTSTGTSDFHLSDPIRPL